MFDKASVKVDFGDRILSAEYEVVGDSITAQGQESCAYDAPEDLDQISAENVGIALGMILLVERVHNNNVIAGWWTSLEGEDLRYTSDNTGPKRNVPEMLALIHSEISEGLEGYRKNLMDDKLPHRPMLEVEMADAVIRICDLCGGLGLDLGGAILEKLAFNQTREDHKIENRKAEDGKKI